MNQDIDKKYLAGLKFRSAKQVKTEKGPRWQETERALQPGDVLSWKDTGAAVVIVTSDGRKYKVAK